MAEKLKVVIDSEARLGAFNSFLGKLPSLRTLAVGAGVAVAGAGAAIFAMAKTTAAAYDKVQKFSDQLDLSTEFLSKMQVAADFSGVKVQTLNKSVQMLTVRMGEAARGIGQGKEAFEQVGVSIRNTDGSLRSAEEIMPDLADGFRNMANATERAEAASKIFGQRGIEMLQLFKGGKDGLKAMTDEAEKFGLVISAKAGANAAEFNDSLTRVFGSLKGLKNTIAEEVMPTITGLANHFADFVADNRDKIIDFGRSFVSVLGKALEYGSYAIAGLVDAWRGLNMVFNVLKIGLNSFVQVMLEGLSFVTQKLLTFMEATNVGGVFDGAINSVQGFLDVNKDVIFALEQTSTQAYNTLNSLVDEGFAVEKVKEFSDTIKQTLKDIEQFGEIGTPGATGSTAEGFTFADPAHLAKEKELLAKREELQAEAILRVQEMFDEYYLTEEEKLDLWYEKQVASIGDHDQAKLQLHTLYNKKRLDIIKKQNAVEKRVEEDKQRWAKQQMDSAIDAIGTFGKRGKKIWKVAKTAEAIISTAAGAARALSEYTYPYSLAVMAAVLVSGFAQVARINSAHTGLTRVPAESPYLLDRGERVVSRVQNEDLTRFLENEEAGSVGGQQIFQMEMHILENATSAEALLEMSPADWEEIIEDRVIPGLNALSQIGIKPTY